MTMPRRSDPARTRTAGAQPEAAAEPQEQQDAPVRKSYGPILKAIGALTILTALAAGSGGLLGLYLVGSVESAIQAKAMEGEPPPEPLYAAGTNIHRLSPVVANLAAPEDTWVRVEASLVFDGEVANPDVISSQVAEDMVAYLRTVSAGQLEGASGLLHLREDLNDRVAIRSNRLVRELIIETLVVQ